MTNYNEVSTPKKDAPKKEVDQREVYQVQPTNPVNVRDLDKEGREQKIGILKPSQRVHYMGVEEEYDGYTWLKVDAGSIKGFVRSDLIEKV